jgi:lysophospholipase L1-like esterase
VITTDFKTVFVQSPFMKQQLLRALALLLLLAANPRANALAQDAAVADKPAATKSKTDEAAPGVGPVRAEDWFVNIWRQRRDKFAADEADQQHALVFLGDSITQGWSDDFRGFYPNVKTANRGISGDTSRGLLTRLDDDVLSLNPSAVVLLIGTNDIDVKVPVEGIASNVERLLARLSAHDPKMPVVLCHVFPSSAKMNRPADKIRKLNQLLADVARGNTQVTVLDTYTLFANAEGDAKPEEFPDLLHLNDAGYEKWRAALWPVLATLGFVDTEHDSFTHEAGFEPLFNGQNLDGWGFRPTTAEDLAAIKNWRASDPNMPPWPIVKEPVNFDGKTESNDGRYRAINGRLVVTTPTEGRRIQQLYTIRDFPNDFTLKLEFRATPNADSGVFLRGRQLQCRDYPLAGPYKNLKNYKPGQWNELVVTVKGNKAHCTVNGELLEAAYELPETGPIGFEGDRGQMEYRRIRLRQD